MIEEVECPLLCRLSENTRLLQKVELDVGSADVAGRVEMHPDKLSLKVAFLFGNKETYKTGGVVILDCFTVSKRLEDGVGLEQLLFQMPSDATVRDVEICLLNCHLDCSSRMTNPRLPRSGHMCQVLDDLLSVFCLSCAGLSPECRLCWRY